MSKSELECLRGRIFKSRGSYQTTIEQLASIRNIIVKSKIIRGHHRMNAQIARITGEYSKGYNILDLSRKYDFPPLNLMRGILLHLKFPPNTIYKIFVAGENPEILLAGRHLEQYRVAAANDAESTFSQQQIAEFAQRNEDILVEYFRKLGIGMRTQNDLVEEQVREHGRAVLTPDILFNEPVIINGHSVRWLDYKDYIGTTVGFLYKSNAEQAAKYVAKWGPGAMCYRHGFVENVSFPSTILLDARSLPIIFEEISY